MGDMYPIGKHHASGSINNSIGNGNIRKGLNRSRPNSNNANYKLNKKQQIVSVQCTQKYLLFVENVPRSLWAITS